MLPMMLSAQGFKIDTSNNIVFDANLISSQSYSFSSGIFNRAEEKKFSHISTVTGIVYLYTENGIITKKASCQDSIFYYLGPVGCPDYNGGAFHCAVYHIGKQEERRHIGIVFRDGGILDESLRFEFIPDIKLFKALK